MSEAENQSTIDVPKYGEIPAVAVITTSQIVRGVFGGMWMFSITAAIVWASRLNSPRSRRNYKLGIKRVKGVKQLGFRTGNWLNREQARTLLEKADGKAYAVSETPL